MTSDEETSESGDVVETGTILNRSLNDEMKTSYINYAMSVIIGRALPDARDGLKPKRRLANLLVQLVKSWVNTTRTATNQFTTLWFEWLKNSLSATH